MRSALLKLAPTLPRSLAFRRLWVGQSVSLVGTQVTLLALPLAAVLFLNASPDQMGLLVAAEMLPVLVLSLLVGVWVDRLRRRPLLIVADLGRAVCIGSVPVVAALGALRMEYLYVVSFAMGVLSLVSDTASSAFLPTLVAEDDLALAYSATVLTESTAEVVGPGLAGMLGAMLAPRLIGRIGLHQTFVITVLLVPLALAITPLATGTAVVAGSVLLVGQALFQTVLMASNVCFRMLRQQLSPPEMLGRVNATMRMLTWGGLPVGALLGGLLGEHLGLRPALGVAAVGAMLGCAWLIPLLTQSASRTRTRGGLFARA